MFSKTDPIGIRVLTKDMMNCSFTHTNEVLSNIEEIRKTAYNVHDQFRSTLQKHSDQGIMAARGYNNAISILGSRGAGKTSIIMTLQHILRYGVKAWENNTTGDVNKTNIMMPILVPQDFSQGQSLLSWVVMQLLQKGEEIEKIITKEKMFLGGLNGPFAQWNLSAPKHTTYDPLRECMDSLTKSFELRYKRDAGYETKDSNHVFEYMDEVRRDASLVLDMLRLVSMIVDFYRYQQPREQGKDAADCEPLIFFVIDDMDLAPSRSQEVLTLVLRYLLHPNIVVLCGWNQELFQSHLCMDLLKTQGSLDSKLLDTNFGFDDVFMTRQRKRVAALDSARRLAMDNLKKAFPPALRYEIRGLSTIQRAWFPNTPTNTVLPDTEDCFFNVICTALRACRADDDVPIEFLYNNGKAIWAYMRIFDNKARGMENSYHAFLMLYQSVSQWDKTKPFDITSHITALIDTLLFSNTHFVPYRRGLRDLIRIDKVEISPHKSTCKYFCNFQAAEKILREYSAAIEAHMNKQVDMFYVERQYNYFPSIIIDTYILLNFIENMLMYISGEAYYEHGGSVFSRILNEIIPPIRNIPNPDDLLSCALALSGVKKINLFPETKNFRINLLLLNAYESHRLSDENYSFSGIHSYCQLSRALLDAAGGEANSNEQANNFSDLSDDWFPSMESLFTSLKHSPKNVKRVNIYRTLLYQSTSESTWDVMLLIDSLIKKTVSIESWNKEELQKHPITMHELGDIVYLIRYISTVIRKWNRTNTKDKEGIDRVKREKDIFVYIFSKYSNFDANTVIIDIQECRDLFDHFRRNSDISYVTSEANQTSKTVDSEGNSSVVDYAVQYANLILEALISNLKFRLQYACYKTYIKKTNVYDQFLYLLDISKRIPDILYQFQLGIGAWSTRQYKAAYTLMEILQQYGIEELYSDARQIFELGPTLVRTSRDIYIQCIQRIKRWFEREYDLFSSSDQKRIDNIINVLQSAYQSIPRDTAIEARVRSVIVSFGHDVAVLCAKLAADPKMPDGRVEHYQREVVWPVPKVNRNEFKKWEAHSFDPSLFA